MAPSRKRKASAAAAAAAARRQWKVGDLVLAKVKGFPAWPATVSEPEKWGFRPDWKKVLVYFFGTQQIAFCNPVDVEAFTEEKKQSLLVKRQGKGADFVRAVQEIIDSFEKAKKLESSSDSILADEASLSNGRSPGPPPALPKVEGQKEISEANPVGANNSNVPSEIVLDVKEIGVLDDKEALLDEQTDKSVVCTKPAITTYASKKRSGGLRCRKHALQKPNLEAERSRTSSWLESNELNKFTPPSNDVNKGADSLFRNNLTRNSPNISQWDDMEASPFASNGSVEQDGSENAGDHSESHSLSGVCTTGGNCRVECSDSVVECVEGDMELEKGLDFQIKDVPIKKKRKSSRKRITNDVAQSAARQESDAVSEARVHSSNQNIENDCEHSSKRFSKEDGDEHLPLVKRARVRMSQASSFKEEHSHFPGAEEKPFVEVSLNLMEEHGNSNQAVETMTKDIIGNILDHTEVTVNLMEKQGSLHQADEAVTNGVEANILDHAGPSKNFDDNCYINSDSRVSQEASQNCLPEKDFGTILGDRRQILSDENNSFGCSADDESALPPSKRLHRALEAMSVNVCLASTSDVTNETKGENDMGEVGVSPPGKQNSTFCSVSNPIPEASTCNQLDKSAKEPSVRYHSGSARILSPELCKDGMSASSTQNLSGLFSETVNNAVQGQSLVDLDHNHEKEAASLQSSRGLNLFSSQAEDGKSEDTVLQAQSASPSKEICAQDQGCSEKINLRNVPSESCTKTLCSRHEGDSENIESREVQSEYPSKELYALDHTRLSLDVTPRTCEDAKFVSQNGGNALDDNNMCSDNNESSRSQADCNTQANGMYEIADDIKCDQSLHADCHFSGSVDGLDHVDMFHTQLSPLAVEGKELPVLASPPATSICQVSTSESVNGVQNSGCSSPIANSYQKKMACSSVSDEEKIESAAPQRPKSVGKGRDWEEGHAALSSFEGMLGSLARTKESIGRATRLAIDCGKLGLSSKVVEIIARNLETESNLHRRVDLFFLVDSIAQCSRGLKGEVGGIYLPVIEAALERLITGAVPPGSSALENRRQCLKVLKLWLERKIFPETVIRHLMRQLDFHGDSSVADPYARRSERTERPLDDPVRDMEGMLVDEYGSNSTFQLPGFCMPQTVKVVEDESDSDGESFEAVTPEHYSETPEEQKAPYVMEKHTHILEDVDGELEMEDVAPAFHTEMTSTIGIASTENQFEQHSVPPFSYPQPQDVGPLLSFPPPALPLPPLLPPASDPSSLMPDHYANGLGSNHCTNLHNMPNDSRQPVNQSITPRVNQSMPNGMNVDTHENGSRGQDRHCDSTNSFSGYFGRPADNISQGTDGPSFHSKSYPPRTQCPPSSNHFSNGQGGQHMKPWREDPPPSYSHRFHSSHNGDGGNFYHPRERLRPAPYEQDEGWRYPPPPYPGPRYHDDSRASYPHGRYSGSQRGRLPHRGWGYPPRGIHHRNYMPFRSHPEGAIPATNRASGNWRPR